MKWGRPAGRLVVAAVAAYAGVAFGRATDVPVAGDEPAPPVVAVDLDRRPPIVVAVATTQPVVALTFDDGPDPRWTPRVLEALRRTGARATFFVTGEAVRAHPELVREVVAAGHEVANHTDTHPRMDGLDTTSVAEEVAAASMAIGEAGVPQAPFFRPPRGRYDDEALTGVEATGLRPVGWTVCLERSLRDVGGDGAVVAARAVRPGGIVLAHDGGIPDRTATTAALPRLLDTLAERGLRVVTLSELLLLGPAIDARPGVDPRNAPLARAGWR